MGTVHVEMLVEPLSPGSPGRHVGAAVDAVAAHGIAVDFGPFGSSFAGDPAQVAAALGDALLAAVAGGASRLTIQVTVEDGT